MGAARMTIVARVILQARHARTDHTRHYRDALPLPSAHQLEVAKFEEEPGYYLLYLDEEGQEMTDTYHDSFEEALAQAQFEFGVVLQDWEIAPFDS